MSQVEEIQPSGDKMKKTITWISEMVLSHPEKSRRQIISEAEVRFDLSPKESDFLNRKFSQTLEKQNQGS
jgi:hypothetical protein